MSKVKPDKFKFGCFHISRSLLQSEIWEKPPGWLKIWVFILSEARHQAKGRFKVGEFITTYKEISEQCGTTYSVVDNCLRFLKKKKAITTRKTTLGIVVFVLNYTKYQCLKNYKTTQKTIDHETETIEGMDDTQECKNDKNDKKESTNVDSKAQFEKFWKLYPNKKNRKKAFSIFQKLDPQVIPKVLAALPLHIKSVDWQKDGGAFIPHPTTWLNGERWNDELEVQIEEEEIVNYKGRDMTRSAYLLLKNAKHG